jgi:hypothetical protein
LVQWTNLSDVSSLRSDRASFSELTALAKKSQANAVWLQLHALAYNLANFLRTLALPDGIENCR